MQLDRNGFPILTGPMLMFELPEPTQPVLVTRGLPADLKRRGFYTHKEWHYPTEILYRLQRGRCFYCWRPVNPEKFSRANPTGMTKQHFYPRSRGFTLFGNKVIACGSCGAQYKDEMPTPEQKGKFNKIYSRKKFKNEIGEE